MSGERTTSLGRRSPQKLIRSAQGLNHFLPSRLDCFYRRSVAPRSHRWAFHNYSPLTFVYLYPSAYAFSGVIASEPEWEVYGDGERKSGSRWERSGNRLRWKWVLYRSDSDNGLVCTEGLKCYLKRRDIELLWAMDFHLFIYTCRFYSGFRALKPPEDP